MVRVTIEKDDKKEEIELSKEKEIHKELDFLFDELELNCNEIKKIEDNRDIFIQKYPEYKDIITKQRIWEKKFEEKLSQLYEENFNLKKKLSNTIDTTILKKFLFEFLKHEEIDIDFTDQEFERLKQLKEEIK